MKHRQLLPGCYSRRRRVSHSSTRWWHVVRRSSSDPVPDRHLCIHEQSQPHYQCSYPGPYSLDLLHFTLEDAHIPYYEMIDLSDIWDLQDVMTTTSDEDIPDLEDIFGLWIWTMVWINIYTPWTLSKMNWYRTVWNKMDIYKCWLHVPCDYENLCT